MKKLLLTSLFFVITSYSYGDVTLKECRDIQCDKIKDEDKNKECQLKKRKCHKDLLEVQITAWKKQGITEEQKKKVVEALTRAKGRSQEALTELEEKVKLSKEDIRDIDAKIKEVNSLKSQKK
jgi:hypothetical protein